MEYKKSVLLGLSGGVDSAYSAYLLKKQGFDITGVYLQMHSFADETYAMTAAQNLDIPFITADCTQDFKKYVEEYFVEEYSNGRTPNPCVVCNRYVKVAKLIEIADSLNINYISTGHYVRVKQNRNTGKYYICKAKDEKKDQSYFLWKLSDNQLSRLISPLAEYDKEYIKNDAINQSVLTHKIGESQEICFIPDNDYKTYIENIRGKYPEGNFISKDGSIIGKHKGIIY
jgi:tRNA-specific 2-thiouridylase